MKKNKQFQNIIISEEKNITGHSWQFGHTRTNKLQIAKSIIVKNYSISFNTNDELISVIRKEYITR